MARGRLSLACAVQAARFRLARAAGGPTVSVIVPLHAEEEFVEDCLRSVRRQSYPDLECIVVDDASVDGGPAIARRFADRDPRFVVIEHARNRGLAAARNTGLARARGRFVVFLDADDELLPHTIWRRVLSLRQHDAADVAGAYCATLVTNEQGRHPQRRLASWRTVALPEKDFLVCGGECPFNVHAALVKRAVVERFGGFAQDMRRGCEDWDLWLRVLRHGYRFVPSPHLGAIYRQRRDGMVRRLAAEHFGEAARLVDRAYEPLPAGETLEGTPVVFRRPLSEYQRAAVKARRAVEFAAVAHRAGRPADAKRIAAWVPGDECALLGPADRVVSMARRGLRRFSARPGRAPPPHERTAETVDAAVVANRFLRRARRALAAEGFRHGHPGAEEAHVLLVPHNAYHTREMSQVLPHLGARGLRALHVNVARSYQDEGAEETMRLLGLEYVDDRPDLVDLLRPRAVLVMNDWGGVVRERVEQARALGIPTLGLVEGAQDFNDAQADDHERPRRREPYRRVAFPLLMGEYDRRFFADVPAARIVGSPRIESLLAETAPLPARPLVVVNCNFSYGVHPRTRDEWVRGAAGACERAGVEFVISRHPLDETALDGLPVAREPLYDVLRRATLLVSRFSSAIFEALALGRPVIYHNPHGERVETFLDPMGGYPVTHGADELARAIGEVAAAPAAWRRRAEPFFRHHVSVDPRRPAALRIADALAEAAVRG